MSRIEYSREVSWPTMTYSFECQPVLFKSAVEEVYRIYSIERRPRKSAALR